MNALGLSRRDTPRPYGRGETARRVEASRTESYASRPAVYTSESKKQGLLSRFHAPSFALPDISVPVIPTWVLLVVGVVIALSVMFGPARNYYLAWREAGVLAAKYEVLAAQNEELNHEIDRLQSLEGIEDEARHRGYVYPDEEALVVEGVEDELVADPALVDAAVEEHEQSMPWFVGALDALFGYKKE